VCYRVRVTPDRPSVTELPGLTSDPICTADRRGGILISFGPKRGSRQVINPSTSFGSASGPGRGRPHRRIHPERPVTLKGVGTVPAAGREPGGPARGVCPASFALRLDGGSTLKTVVLSVPRHAVSCRGRAGGPREGRANARPTGPPPGSRRSVDRPRRIPAERSRSVYKSLPPSSRVPSGRSTPLVGFERCRAAGGLAVVPRGSRSVPPGEGRASRPARVLAIERTGTVQARVRRRDGYTVGRNSSCTVAGPDRGRHTGMRDRQCSRRSRGREERRRIRSRRGARCPAWRRSPP